MTWLLFIRHIWDLWVVDMKIIAALPVRNSCHSQQKISHKTSIYHLVSFSPPITWALLWQFLPFHNIIFIIISGVVDILANETLSHSQPSVNSFSYAILKLSQCSKYGHFYDKSSNDALPTALSQERVVVITRIFYSLQSGWFKNVVCPIYIIPANVPN